MRVLDLGEDGETEQRREEEEEGGGGGEEEIEGSLKLPVWAKQEEQEGLAPRPEVLGEDGETAQCSSGRPPLLRLCALYTNPA